MISKETIAGLQADERQVHYILGARLRNVKEIYQTVLSRGGRYRVVHEARHKSTDPSPLKVKEVRVDERRYVVCLNDEQAKKDHADREAIVSALREQVKQNAKSMVGNKGYRKYLRDGGKKFAIDEAKVKRDSRFAVRRQVGLANGPERDVSRGRGFEVQTIVDGRRHVPHRQNAARDASDLPSP